MRGRIYLGGTAIAAASLIVGVGVAPAATRTAATPVLLKCHISLTTAAPPGQQSVDVPPAQGTQYGPAHCGTQLGTGIQADSFRVPDTGDMVGAYTQYFSTGSIHGKFDLAPQTGLPPSSTSFQSQAWAGTLTVTGGTGSYVSASGKKGTFKCTSPDSVHLQCTEKIKATL